MDLEDIPAIQKIFAKYIKQDYYESNHDSIWDYDTMFDILVHDYINFAWLEEYWKEHPELEMYWYDSY